MAEFRAVERRTRPIKLERGEKLIIRLWSWDEARIMKDAQAGHEIDTVEAGRPPDYYSVSVFALALDDGESVDDLVDRLRLHAADNRKFKWYCLVTETELNEANFELILNEPPDDHYDIPVGLDAIDPTMVTNLALLFGDEKIRMRT